MLQKEILWHESVSECMFWPFFFFIKAPVDVAQRVSLNILDFIAELPLDFSVSYLNANGSFII